MRYSVVRRPLRLLGFAGLIFVSLLNLQAQDQLIVLSPHWEGVKYEFTQAFEKYYQQKYGRTIEVHWRDLGGGTSQMEKAINALYQSNHASCDLDVFFGGGTDPYENQKRLGHLIAFKLPDELLLQIPRQVQGVNLVDPDFMYYGAALSSFGILQNLPVCRELRLPPVQNWEDLTQPALQGWISSADPRKSGSVHMIYEIILQAYGWAKGWAVLYQMSGNIRSFLQDSAAPTKEVSAADVAYGLTIDVNGLAQQTFFGSENIRFFIPQGLSVINPDSIAIFKGAPHLPAAQEFLQFVLSPAGQSLWMVPEGQPGGAEKFGINRMGILPSLYSATALPDYLPTNPFTSQAAFIYQDSLGALRWQLVNELIGQTMIDVLPHLQAAWKAINHLPPEVAEPLKAEFSRPFLAENQVKATASLWRKDPAAAARLSNLWMQQAVERFDHLTRQAQRLSKTPI